MAKTHHKSSSASNSFWSLCQTAETRVLTGNYQSAVEIFTIAIQSYPNEPNLTWAYAHRGEAQRLSQNLNDAQSDLETAINLDGTNTWAYAYLGEVYRNQGNLDAARECFSAAINLDSSYAWAYAHRGASYDLRDPNQVPTAIEDFTTAINLNNEYAWAYACRSGAYFVNQQGQEAYLDLLKAVSLDCNVIEPDFVTEFSEI